MDYVSERSSSVSSCGDQLMSSVMEVNEFQVTVEPVDAVDIVDSDNINNIVHIDNNNAVEAFINNKFYTSLSNMVKREVAMAIQNFDYKDQERSDILSAAIGQSGLNTSYLDKHVQYNEQNLTFSNECKEVMNNNVMEEICNEKIDMENKIKELVENLNQMSIELLQRNEIIKLMEEELSTKEKKMQLLNENLEHFMDENVRLKNNAKQLKENNTYSIYSSVSSEGKEDTHNLDIEIKTLNKDYTDFKTCI